jgi:hypothetical protein
MAAVHPEPWLRALITNNNAPFLEMVTIFGLDDGRHYPALIFFIG